MSVVVWSRAPADTDFASEDTNLNSVTFIKVSIDGGLCVFHDTVISYTYTNRPQRITWL